MDSAHPHQCVLWLLLAQLCQTCCQDGVDLLTEVVLGRLPVVDGLGGRWREGGRWAVHMRHIPTVPYRITAIYIDSLDSSAWSGRAQGFYT